MPRVKFVNYTGEWPNLCSGFLTLEVDGVTVEFPEHCLSSGGETYFSDDYAEGYTCEGDWSIKRWPVGFPEELKEEVLQVVNENIRHGCCGGCL